MRKAEEKSIEKRGKETADPTTRTRKHAPFLCYTTKWYDSETSQYT